MRQPKLTYQRIAVGNDADAFASKLAELGEQGWMMCGVLVHSGAVFVYLAQASDPVDAEFREVDEPDENPMLESFTKLRLELVATKRALMVAKDIAPQADIDGLSDDDVLNWPVELTPTHVAVVDEAHADSPNTKTE